MQCVSSILLEPGMGGGVVLGLEGREYNAQFELGTRALEHPWSWICEPNKPKARQVGSALHKVSAASKHVAEAVTTS